MSIRSRLMLRRHLDEAAMAALWTDAILAGVDAPDHPHLQTCAACRARLAEYGGWLDELREEARTAADQAFGPDRLATQQAQIARRLEALERPARVIAFPRFAPPAPSGPSSVRRWIAAAAVAGLMTGFGLEQLFHVGERFGTGPAGARFAEGTASIQPGGPALTPASLVDDAYFWNIEEAIPPRVDELMALDALTPRTRDISMEVPR